MAKKPATAKTPADEDTAANAPAPDGVDQKQYDDDWAQMSAKHADPNGDGMGAIEPDGDVPTGDLEGEAEAAPAAQGDPEPAQAPVSDPYPEPAQAAQAPADGPDIWAKAATDPDIALLKKQRDEGPESAHAAIDAMQKRFVERGQEISTLRTARSEAKKRPAAAPAPVAEPVPSYDYTTDPDWIAAKEDYPDALGAVESVLTKALKNQSDTVEARIAPISAMSKEVSLEREREYLSGENTTLHALIPSYTEVVKSPDFGEKFGAWADGQSDQFRSIIQANTDFVTNGKDVAMVMREFDRDTGYGIEIVAAKKNSPAGEPANPPNPSPEAIRRSLQLDSSAAVETSGSGATPSADTDDSEYWRTHWLKRREQAEAVERALR